MLRLGLRNVLRHRARTAITLAAIAFGVVGLILTGGFVRDIFVQLGEALIHSQSGHLQVFRAGYYESGTRSPERFLIENAAALQGKLAQMPEVEQVMARLAFTGLLNNGRTDWAIVGEGVEPGKEARLGTYLQITAGSQLSDTDVDGVLIGYGVAQALKLAPGDRVTLVLNTASGAMNTLDLRVVGVFQSFSKDFDARAVRVPVAAAQDVLQSSGVTSVVVQLERTHDTLRVANRVQSELAGTSLEVRNWIQLNDFYEKTVELYGRQFGVLQLIILAMVLLSVVNSMNITVFERLGEFGTMMAVGNRRREIFGLILIEGALLGLIGSALGVVIGLLLAVTISAIGIPMPPPPNANVGYTAHIRIVPEVLALAFAVGLVAAIVAAIPAAFKVSRTSLDLALRANL